MVGTRMLTGGDDYETLSVARLEIDPAWAPRLDGDAEFPQMVLSANEL